MKAELYEAAIRSHRDQRGDDRCWMDDEELYKILPEGYTPPVRDTTVELENCIRFISCRRIGGTEYVSPQRRIEQLEKEILQLIVIWGDGESDIDVADFCEQMDKLRELVR